MSMKRRWLPREGFTADVVGRLVRNTALNPALTLPLLLIAHYTRTGRELSIGHETALRRLNVLLYIGVARLINAYLSQGALNNWQKAKYDWVREVVVVTGGSDGIGKQVSFLLADKGCKVASLDIQPPTFEPRSNIYHYPCDISSPQAVSETAASIRSTLGNPTILINNAGTGTRNTILESTEKSIQRIFEVNIFSHFRLVREFLPSMVSKNHGTVVTIASSAACASTPHIVDYCCTKAAALAFHEGLAAELATQYDAPKVRTIAILPGWVETNMTKAVKVPDKFVVPMQKVETVAEKVVQKILSGDSGVVMIPESCNWVIWPLRMLPMWWQSSFRNRIGRLLRKAKVKDDAPKPATGNQ